MNRIALLIALGLAVLGGTMLWLYKQRFEADVGGGPPVAILVLVRDVALGTPLQQADLAVRDLPSAYVEARHVRAADLPRLVGVRTATHLRSNDALLWTDVAAPSTFARNLSGVVRAGMRAVPLGVGGLEGLVRPGDRIDILLSTGQGASQRIETIAQAVLVGAVGTDLGAGTSAPTPPARGPRAAGITVLLTTEQALLIAQAQNVGRLSFTLRNPDDVAIVDLDKTVKALAEAAVEAAAAQPARGPAPADVGELADLASRLEAIASAAPERGSERERGRDLADQLRTLEALGRATPAARVPAGLPPPAEVR